MARQTLSSAERRKKFRRIDFLDTTFWYPTQLEFFAVSDDLRRAANGAELTERPQFLDAFLVGVDVFVGHVNLLMGYERVGTIEHHCDSPRVIFVLGIAHHIFERLNGLGRDAGAEEFPPLLRYRRNHPRVLKNPVPDLT